MEKFQKNNQFRKAFLNTLTIIFSQIITIIVGFIIPNFIITFYGSETNGLINTINQIISYFALLQIGLSTAVTYSLYRPLANNNQNETNQILSAASVFYKKSGYFYILFGFITALLFPIFVKSDLYTSQTISLLIFSMLIPGVLEFFILSKYRILLIADFQNYIISFANIVSLIINLLIVFFLSPILNILYLRILMISQNIFSIFFIFLFVKRKYPKLNLKENFEKNILNKRWSAFKIQIISIFQQTFPILFISSTIGLNYASVYSIYNMIILGIINIIGLINNSFISIFGQYIAKKDFSGLKRLFNKYVILYYFIISVIYSLIYINFMPFIEIYTRNFIDTNYIDQLLAFLIISESLVSALRAPLGMVINAAGLFKESTKSSLIQLFILISFSIFLGQMFGIYGIIVSSFIAHLYRNFEMLLFVKRNVFEISTYKYLLWEFLMIFPIIIVFYFSKFYPLLVINYLDWILFSIIFGLLAILFTFSTWLVFQFKEFSILIKFFRNHLKI